jgi:23S rRNA pseudouridine1911/1915/1917 synthase
MRVDQVLARLYPEHSRGRLQAWLKAGLILVDGCQRDPKSKVWGGERISFSGLPPVQTGRDEAQDLDLDVVFEDGAIIVINKPVGLVVHPGNGVADGTLLNGLLHRYPESQAIPRAGIVHRLDKDTSGLLVVARTLEAQTDLVRQLQARTVSRRYLALVTGIPPTAGEVDASIGRHPVHRTRMAVVDGAREARTHYRILERFKGAALVECRLETGRTHQIRVHMGHLGHPLVGDQVYLRRRTGQAVLDAFPRQALHAWRLGLIHPVSREPMNWEAGLPDDMQTLLTALRDGRDA